MLIAGTFHELRLPISENGVGEQDWSTCDADNVCLYYLLNDGSNRLSFLFDALDNDEFYFDTEVLCHEAMADYYWHHNVLYPYISEWREARATMFGAKPATINSQVMRFK